MKKTLYITIILFIVFIGLIQISKANVEENYTNIGLTINNNKIFINSNIEANSSENNICIESGINKKECILKTNICMYKCENLILPVDEKGIFYMEDEFNLKFYDINSKKDIYISSAISRILSPYEVDHDMSNLTWDDRYFNSFTDKSLNAEKNKLAVEIVYNDPATTATLTSMLCVVDINKLSAGNEDYVECPVVTTEMRNLDYPKIPKNIWKSEELPILNGWTDDKTISIKTDKGDNFTLDTVSNTLENKSRNIFYVLALSIAGILVLGGIGYAVMRMKKKRKK
jgi:hypothetical protein